MIHDPNTLTAAAEMLALGRPLPPDALQVVVSSLRALAAGPGPETASFRRGRRDALLRQLRREHFADLPPVTSARTMLSHLDRYAASRWNLDRAGAGCPYPADSLAASLFAVMKLGGPPGLRRLIDIIVE